MNIKGQLSYVIKPFTLVFMVIILFALFGFLNLFQADAARAERNNELMNTATATLLLLANSEDCLAYQVRETSSSYANIVDVTKLDEFVEKYQGIEPECARSNEFGFQVVVSEVDTSSQWTFGANTFSTGGAYRNSADYWIPVAIRHSEKDVRIGKMSIHLVDGELEELAGFLDNACKQGMLGYTDSMSKNIGISYPIYYTNGNLCIGAKGTKQNECRIAVCNMDFEDIESGGNYKITTKFEFPNRLMVRL